MTKDYSGKKIVNIILLVCAVWLLIANIQHEEYTVAIGMGLVGIVSIANGTLAFLRLKGKKI